MKQSAKRKNVRGCCFAVRDFLLKYPATREQAYVLLALSLFARADGSKIFPGRDNLQKLARIRSKELKAAIDHWRKLGVLVLIVEARPKYAAEYSINLDQMSKLLRSLAEPSVDGDSVPNGNRDVEANSVPESADSVPESSQLGSQPPPTRFPSGTPREVPSQENPSQEEAGGDALRAAAAAADGQIRSAFQLFDNDHPFGSLQFQLEWVDTVATASQYEGNLDAYRSDLLPDVIERAIQNCLRKNISIPPPLYREKRLAEQARDATMRARLQR